MLLAADECGDKAAQKYPEAPLSKILLFMCYVTVRGVFTEHRADNDTACCVSLYTKSKYSIQFFTYNEGIFPAS